ncbi:hypothetical protein FRC19_001059 [Serendipita sp. 401]|nr:hypothetical protein FRC19_001059 [Serendipita sp. 401]
MPSSVSYSIQCERPPEAPHLVSPVLVPKPNWKSQWQPFALPTISISPPSSSSSRSSTKSNSSSAAAATTDEEKEEENPPEKVTGPHRHQSSSQPTTKRGGSVAVVVAASNTTGGGHHNQKDKGTKTKVTAKGAAARAPIIENRILFHQKTTSYNEFTNFANYEIVYEGRVFPTSEHLFQASKFMKARPDIAEYIRTSSARPSQAASLGRAYQAFLRSDWSQIQIAKMDEILELKFTQHPELMQLLLGTGDAELVQDSSDDSFWGNGPDEKGRNELGRALMRLRRKFQRKYRLEQVMTMHQQQQQQNHKRRDSQKL